MGEFAEHASKVPPWAWVLIYVGGGGAIGAGGVGFVSHETRGAPTVSTDPGGALSQAQSELEELKRNHENMVISLNMITQHLTKALYACEGGEQ